MQLQPRLHALSAAIVLIVMIGSIGAAPPARADDSSKEKAWLAQAYELELSSTSRTGTTTTELAALAASLGATLKLVRFEGKEGVGELVVPPGASETVIGANALDLFTRVKSTVPPIVSAVVTMDADPATPNTTARRLTATVGSSRAELHPLKESARSYGLARAARSVAVTTPTSQNAESVTAAVVNDWSPYFPSDWRAEGFNMNRCTDYSNGVCHSSFKAASLNQQFTWMGDHKTNLWPSSAFGIEVGVSLKNNTFCDDDPNYTPGYWLNPNYYEWATSVPDSAVPYLDTNRFSDTCGSLSHELGVRYPATLISGAAYIFTLTTARNIYNSRSTYGASFQAVHDDCGVLPVSTDCMGLSGDLYGFPWGHQAEVVVNQSRSFSFPNCARMHDKWSVPIQWSNGSRKLLPAPLSYYDSCFANDWQ